LVDLDRIQTRSQRHWRKHGAGGHRGSAKTQTRNILANDIIQQWRIYSKDEWDPEEGIGLIIPKVVLDHEPQVSTIAIGSDEELKGLSLERNLALQDSDIPVIRQYFLREDIQAERKKHGLTLPTDVELEYISQARSDHCNHNTFKGLFRYHDLSSGHKDMIFPVAIRRSLITSLRLALKRQPSR
jgi:phosphoribosylformylglycinamidine synthase